jgi:isopenicillin N synthase-like dioxygenase
MHGRTTPPPIIDIGALLDAPTSAAAGRCGEEMHAACLGTGFFVAVGHGLDAPMAAAFDAARAFFAAPQEVKERTPRVDRYGYVPHADLAIDRSRQHGQTEWLDLGLADEVGLPDLPGFRDAVRSYEAAALTVAGAMLAALAVRLGAGHSFFSERMTEPQCRLRFLHYLPTPLGPDGALAVPTTPHTDYGALTMLATDGVPGLEVKPIGSDWVPVEAPASSLVINIGDMLARWTNDVYRSTPHRVVGSPTRERLSIPFFVNPNRDTVVECVPSCVTDERPCRYLPVTASEFLAARIDGREEPYVDPAEGPVRRALI